MGGSCIIDSTDPFSITCMSQWLFRLRKRHVLSRDVRDKGSYLLSLTIINWIHPPLVTVTTRILTFLVKPSFATGILVGRKTSKLSAFFFPFNISGACPTFLGRHSEVVFEVQRFIESPKLACQVAQAKRGVLCKQSEPNELHVFIRNKFLFCFQGETL